MKTETIRRDLAGEVARAMLLVNNLRKLHMRRKGFKEDACGVRVYPAPGGAVLLISRRSTR